MPPNTQQQPSQFSPQQSSPVPPTVPKPVTPPVIPTIQIHPTQGGHTNFVKPILIILALVIILAGAYVFMGRQNISGENVSVKDNNKSAPSAFPKDLFIESSNVIQSNTLVYPDKNLTLYSLSFNSLRQAEELYAMYGKYLQDNKYQIMNQTKSSTQMSYNAIKDKNDLLIVISPATSGASVQLSFVTRQ